MTRRNNRYVLHRDNNVLQVDFSREPNPPAPRFPGASGLRGLGQEDSELNWLVDANHVSGPLAGQRLPAARSPASGGAPFGGRKFDNFHTANCHCIGGLP